MTSTTFVWGSPQWLQVSAGLGALAAALVLWTYARSRASVTLKVTCGLLKAIGFLVLALALLEPMLAGTRPKRGANAFAILADNSKSLQIRDLDGASTRASWMRSQLVADAPWAARLGQDFDVRRYAFDSHARAVEDFEALTFEGDGSALNASLAALAKRFRGLPLAGVLLFTDGNRTDALDIDTSMLPPIYPVLIPSRGVARDVGVTQVAVSQTNFESAPVVIRAEVAAFGEPGAKVVANVTDESGKEVARDSLEASARSAPLGFRFQFRPESQGVHFYKINAFFASNESAVLAGQDDASAAREQTLANNSRLVVVDQGGGPYRVLYVGGRPSWEFKFLRRAEGEDEQVQLVGLIRIARRQPKFDFRNPNDRSNSVLFKGFDNPDEDTAERHDQPVLVRLGTLDETELRDGFPKTAEELYRYHAVILDDMEAAFFTQDQQSLLRGFVGRRGGGLLMLGGPDSFSEGGFARSPISEILPIYINKATPAPANPRRADGSQKDDGPSYRLLLTREGWLQPWVRTRKTEDDERARLDAMPPFRTLSRAGDVKPGATVLAQVRGPDGASLPALAAQRFGKGHAAALLIGDLWRWGLRRKDASENDMDRAWRQTVRWLVGDVPQRVDVEVKPKEDTPSAVALAVRVRDAEFRPLDNAQVTIQITPPSGPPLNLEAEPGGGESGTYVATYVTQSSGAYRMLARATSPDGSEVGQRETGWAAQPSADEFARLDVNRDALRDLAEKTGGELIEGDRLNSFAAGLAARGAPVTEPWTTPLWHQPAAFLVAIACLAAEWGLRRVNGLA